MENKELVAQKIGQGVSIQNVVFTPDQVQMMENILTIVDKNPILTWRDGDTNHNQDFCMIAGKIEPVKTFCLKCVKVGGLSVVSENAPVITPIPGDTSIAVSVTISNSNGQHFSLWGGSTIGECTRGKANARAFHDALARAQTRALKNAVEIALGMAFINKILMDLFGGYEVDMPEDAGIRNVTPTEEKPPVDDPLAWKLWKELWGILMTALGDGIITKQEAEEVKAVVKENMKRPSIVKDIRDEWTRKIAGRREAIHAGN